MSESPILDLAVRLATAEGTIEQLYQQIDVLNELRKYDARIIENLSKQIAELKQILADN